MSSIGDAEIEARVASPARWRRRYSVRYWRQGQAGDRLALAGVVTFTILSSTSTAPWPPDWPTGVALGVGGLAGAYTGARIQSRLPETLIRPLVGILVIAIGARYLWAGLG